MPTVRSKSCFVAPATSATPMPCIISGTSSPSMCTPITRWLAWSTIIFIIVLPGRPDMTCRIGVKCAM